MYCYKITNLLNGKIYVGAKSNATPEESKNYFGSGRDIKKALKEFGVENFTKEILVECNSLEELHNAEIYWIKELDSINPEIGYNLVVGGNSGFNFGKTFSGDHKQKISEAKKGEKNPNFGKTPSEEVKRKMSEAKMGEKNPNFGKTFSDETRRKMSEAKKGERNVAYKMTPEQRSARAKKAWETRRRNQELKEK